MSEQIPVETFEGIEGCWLRGETAEAFISGNPHPRVVAFRLKGGQSPFLVTTANQFYGIRTWFLEPVQTPEAPLPAALPAKLELVGPRSVRLVGSEEPKTQLQVIMEIEIDQSAPILRIRHGLRNLSKNGRTLAAWAINALPHKGACLTPLAKDPSIFRSYIIFNGVDASDPSLKVGCDAVGIDYRLATRKGWVKTGTNTDAGYVAYLWGNQALKSSVAYEPGANYPEGGGTITMFQLGKSADQGFCEIENVGPLKNVAAGQTLWMDQELQLISNVPLEGDSVDSWRAALDQACEAGK